MFRTRNLLVPASRSRDGMRSSRAGAVSLYEPRGEFQLVVEHLEEAGEGALRRRFEELKQKLAAEGLFDPAQPQATVAAAATPHRRHHLAHGCGDPRHPARAAGGAFRAVPVLVYPVAGAGRRSRAGGDRRSAATRRGARDCDVLILARGGGSLEDLWAFNDETRGPRRSHACPIPVVSGIGHEIDFTIADFVADERAPTPSGAAERVVPDRAEWLRSFSAVERRSTYAVRRRLQELGTLLRFRARSLARTHPGARLRQHAQRLDELDTRLVRAVRATLARTTTRVSQASALLQRSSPALRLRALRAAARASRSVRLRRQVGETWSRRAGGSSRACARSTQPDHEPRSSAATPSS